MNTTHLSVSRTARYFSLGPDPARAREIWIVLHGHAQLAGRFLQQCAALDDGETCIAAPEALSRFYLETGRDGRHGELIGATWLTREDREADLSDHLGYLDGLLAHLLPAGGERPRLCLLGFSQGAVMAARWLARGGVRPARAVLWGVPLPADVPPSALARGLADGELRLVVGDADPLVSPGSIEAAAVDLQAAGVAAEVIRFRGGHVMAPSPLLLAAGRGGGA